MRKFFVKREQVGERGIWLTDKDEVKHIAKVLRMKEGDGLLISDDEAYEYEVVIETIGQDGIFCVIQDKQRFVREPELQVTLFQGIPKQGKMDTIIQKTVEMGIKEIIPVFTARTVVEDKGNFGKKITRWEKIAAEAAKQCRRGLVPPVRSAVSFREMTEALGAGGPFGVVIFPYENEENTTIKAALRAFPDGGISCNPDCSPDDRPDGRPQESGACGAKSPVRPRKTAIIIGPEGGFSDEEARLLKEAGALTVTLGKTILRTETAGIVALAMVMYEWEM